MNGFTAVFVLSRVSNQRMIDGRSTGRRWAKPRSKMAARKAHDEHRAMSPHARFAIHAAAIGYQARPHVTIQRKKDRIQPMCVVVCQLPKRLSRSFALPIIHPRFAVDNALVAVAQQVCSNLGCQFWPSHSIHRLHR